MARIKTHDLILTVDPCIDSKSITCMSSGVIAKCMSSKTLQPVPSCYSSKKFTVDCADSGTLSKRNSTAGAPYRIALRDALQDGLAASEHSMPRTLGQVRALERRLAKALKALKQVRVELKRGRGGRR